MYQHWNEHLSDRGRRYLAGRERRRQDAIDAVSEIVEDLHEDLLEESDKKDKVIEERLGNTIPFDWVTEHGHIFGSHNRKLIAITESSFDVAHMTDDGELSQIFQLDEFSRCQANAYYGESFVTLSDIRLKENVADYPYKADLLEHLRVVSFNYKGKRRQIIGLIAQEVLELDSNIIYEDEKEKMLSIGYNELLCVTIQHIQAMEKRLKYLETKLDNKSTVNTGILCLNYVTSLFLSTMKRIQSMFFLKKMI